MFLRGRGGVVFWRRGVRRAGRTRRIRALREVRQQLADQVLEHERGLREIDLILVLEKGVGAAGSQADELAAEKTLSVDARVAVRGNLVVTGIQAHEHHRLVFPQIQIDTGDASHLHAGHGYRRADLEVTDIVEFRGDLVVRGAAEVQAAAGDLGGEERE